MIELQTTILIICVQGIRVIKQLVKFLLFLTKFPNGDVVLIIGVVVISIPHVWQYVIFPEETVTQVINSCADQSAREVALAGQIQ